MGRWHAPQTGSLPEDGQCMRIHPPASRVGRPMTNLHRLGCDDAGSVKQERHMKTCK